MTCHDNARKQSSEAVITDNERSEAKSCNDFCKTKTVMLLVKRHDSEETICSYTLTYIDTRELVPEREGIVLQSDHNQLVCFKEYTEEAYV